MVNFAPASFSQVNPAAARLTRSSYRPSPEGEVTVKVNVPISPGATEAWSKGPNRVGLSQLTS